MSTMSTWPRLLTLKFWQSQKIMILRKDLRGLFAIGVLALALSSIITYTVLLWSRSRDPFWSLVEQEGSNQNSTNIFIWPAPKKFSKGSISMTLSTKFTITPPKNLDVLQAGIHRYTVLLLKQRKLNVPSSSKLPKFVLDELRIKLRSFNQSLYLGVDESYHLQIPDPSNSKVALLQAGTVYGALRGLETFSQICTYDISARTVFLHDCPWHVFDEPRFSYRGLLVDTARHYLPVKSIKNVIDSMAYAKLNVLHWHVVDDESFPLEMPSFPKLWKGSFSSTQRYSVDDAKTIVRYAQLRGINVMPEIDVPGHSRSWGYGYSHLWPSENCSTPLDISKEFTFHVIDGIFSDLSKVFPFQLLHIGGDEVDTTCWETTKPVSDWLMERNLTTAEGYEFFVLEVQKLAVKHGYTPINWQEAFEKFGPSLARNTIVQNWWGLQIAPDVVNSGLKCIVSEQASWYLDHMHISWEKFYIKEPYDNITEDSAQRLILGGEVCMWAEKVDAGNVQQKIWPRAAAAAERFWSPPSSNITNKDLESVATRLDFFRALLTERGISASPLQSLDDKLQQLQDSPLQSLNYQLQASFPADSPLQDQLQGSLPSDPTLQVMCEKFQGLLPVNSPLQSLCDRLQSSIPPISLL